MVFRMTALSPSATLDRLAGGLVVSCQAAPGEPLARPDILAAMAQAAVAGGAVGIRAEGVENIRAIRAAVDVPVIALAKVDYPDSEVYITPTRREALALAATGADIIALDATRRPRPDGETLAELVSALRADSGALLMADVATSDDARAAAGLGFDLIGTTLSGYTAETAGRGGHGPDWNLLRTLVKWFAGAIPIVAEGRFSTPADAARAVTMGAHCVVTGTVITRPTVVTRGYADAVRRAGERKSAIAAGIDLGGTRTAVGLVSGRGELLARRETGSPWPAGTETVVDVACAMLADLEQGTGLSAAVLGVAAGGRFDTDGRVRTAIPLAADYVGFDLAEAFRARLERPVCVENDGAAAAWGEYRAGPDVPGTLAMLTLGTGIGGGIVQGGRLYVGRGRGPSLGHFPVVPDGRPCRCGRRGCLEAEASRAVLQAELAAVRPDLPDPLEPSDIAEAILDAAPHVAAVWNHYLDRLADGLAIVDRMWAPDVLVIGGSLARLDERLLDPLRERLDSDLPLRCAVLGNDAGVVGAALLALERGM